MAPRFTVAIPAYNCASYLRETLQSVLAEGEPPERMQIVVVDDGSSDNPEAVVRELGGERIEFHRQSNQGPCATFNACVGHARGELVHLLHGDDRVRPGFYARVDAVFAAQPTAGMFTCRCREIDDHGAFLRDSYLPPPPTSQLVNDYARLIVPRNHIRTPGVVLRREVYDRMGGYEARLNHTQDWHMWLKAAEWGPVWHEVDLLADYRLHAGSDTSKKFKNGEYLFEIWQAVAFWAEQLTEGRGLRFRDIMDRAIIRTAANDLAAHHHAPERRTILETVFAHQLRHVNAAFRDAIARRLKYLGQTNEPAGRRRVVIFGAGEAGLRAAGTLDLARDDLVAFLDNNRARHGELVFGRPVVEPARLLHLDFDHIVLASMAHEQMYHQLRHLGIDMRDVSVWKPGA